MSTLSVIRLFTLSPHFVRTQVRNGVLQDAQGRPFGTISQGSPQAPPRQDRNSPVVLPPEMQDAVKSVKFIADHFKTKDEGAAVKEILFSAKTKQWTLMACSM